jgi:hypothetical protein
MRRKPIRVGDGHTVVRIIVVRHAFKTAPSRAIVKLAIDLWERRLAIRIFPITPVHIYLFDDKNSRYGKSGAYQSWKFSFPVRSMTMRAPPARQVPRQSSPNRGLNDRMILPESILK